MPGLLSSLLLPLALSACVPAMQPLAERQVAPALQERYVVMQDRVRLPLTYWTASGDPDAVILWLHSFGDFRAAGDLAGPELARRGFSVYAYDQRGFGETPDAGLWPGRDALVDDLVTVSRLLQERYPDRPLYLLGESMGGSIALVADARGRLPHIRGLILAGPGVREDIRWRRSWDALLWTGSRIVPGLSYPIDRTDAGHLNADAARRLRSDARVFQRVRVDTYAGLIRLTAEASDHAARLTRPSLILYGLDDGMVAEASIRALARRHPGDRTVLMQQDGPHLLMQARDQTRAVALIDHWIRHGDAPNAPLGGGWKRADGG